MPAAPRSAILTAFAAIYVLWGSTYLAVALALPSIPPLLLMGTRSVVGGAGLLALAWARGQEVSRCMWLRAAPCGLLLFVACHGTLAYAQQYVPSAMAAIMLATIPFWIALINAVVPGGERPRLQQLVLLAPGLAGVALVVLSHLDVSAGAASPSHLVLLLAAAMAWALGTILSERWSPAHSPVAFSGMELIAGGAVLLAASAFAGELSSFHPGAVSAGAAGAWLYLTIAGTIVAFAAYIWLLKQVSPTLVATYTFVNPIIAVMLGWAVLGERLAASMAIGSVLIIASVAGLLASRHRNRWGREADNK